MICKAKICDTLYDVISYDELVANKDVYLGYIGRVAVDPNDGIIYPLRNPTDIRPGCYVMGGIIILKPPYGADAAFYNSSNVINFSQAKNYKEIIEAQDKLNKAERSILTTIDSVTLPEIGDNDTPAMKALKQAIINKHIDLDKYDYRFGAENYPNDKRLLKRNSITLPKLMTYANALDIAVTLTLEDKSGDVPNPMGGPIVAQLNGKNESYDSEGDSDE
jgi:hypothetical protein